MEPPLTDAEIVEGEYLSHRFFKNLCRCHNSFFFFYLPNFPSTQRFAGVLVSPFRSGSVRLCCRRGSSNDRGNLRCFSRLPLWKHIRTPRIRPLWKVRGSFSFSPTISSWNSIMVNHLHKVKVKSSLELFQTTNFELLRWFTSKVLNVMTNNWSFSQRKTEMVKTVYDF